MSVILCSFSSGLDDLTRKQQADAANVLRVMKSRGRFSAFEASANEVIASTVTDLFKRGLVEDIGGEYPWTKVRITEAGMKILESIK